ncbi:MAG: tRNA-uridine aminocarboxypropyltransferase [Kofleriaceae bacterium]
MQSFAVEPKAPRTTCARCRRPTSVCYCAALPELETTTRIVILQHPRERDMPIGTARMASLCLPNAQLHVGARWDSHAALATALADPARPPILLYPGAGARDILTDPPEGPVTLVVVDGTWSQAKTVVRDNPILHALPRYAFATPEPSHYRIRKEPRAEYVSTIEALMHVLGALEGSPDRFRALLDPLNAMVDAQLAAQARSPRRYSVRVPKALRPPKRALPDVAFEDLVVVVGEANAWPYDAGNNAQRDELVHWLAQRVATGETFSMIARPERPISPTTSFHTQLPEEALLAGTARAEVFDAFEAWSHPSDVMLSWGHYGPSLVLDAGGFLPSSRIDMRATAQRFESKKLGTLDEYAASLGFTHVSNAPAAAPSGAPGRGGERLAMLAHIVRAWNARSE